MLKKDENKPTPDKLTTEEAFELALRAVEQIRDSGVSTEVEKYAPKIGIGYAETVKKYGGRPDRAHPDKWCNVHFYPSTKEQCELIFKRQQELGLLGIHFDSGGTPGARDWELDWSFCYTAEQDDDHEKEQLGAEKLIKALTELLR